MTTHPYLDVDGPIAFAHQGGAGEFPENTMRAFAQAVDLGFTHLETDVHATSDGVVVTFHDDDLDRVTDGSGAVSSLAWRDLQSLRVAGTDPIPRLEEVLETFPSSRVNLDPKDDHVVEPLIELLARLDCLERVCVCSFSDRRTRRIRDALGPDLCVGAGPRAVIRLVSGSLGLPLGAPDCQAAQVPVRMRGLTIVRPRFIEIAHRNDIAVHVWTVDAAGEMHRLLDLGVDGIMTDRPTVLRQVMLDRGLWSA